MIVIIIVIFKIKIVMKYSHFLFCFSKISVDIAIYFCHDKCAVKI